MLTRYEDMEGNKKIWKMGWFGGYGSLKVIGNILI